MIVLGLTGSIGMGKTATAAMFRRLGVPVYDADRAVHEAMAVGGAAVDPVSRAFPGVVKDGAIDRTRLAAAVYGDEGLLGRLEAIVHPLARRARDGFLAAAQKRRAPLVVLEIPLLFETGGEGACDYVAVVTAPAFLQRRRVLARPGMTEQRLRAILARQMSDGEKRARADFVIPTGLGRARTQRLVSHLVRMLKRISHSI